jgi:VIT1/CCC1 family predicted Fe2+/Mn2+ transporter
MHEEKHFEGSQLVRDVVIGMSDGLTVPFALAAGLSGAAIVSNSIIVTAGIAEIVAGSIAMGLGGYLAGKTEIDHYNSEIGREYYEVDNYPEREKQEVAEVFANYGLSVEHQNIIVADLSKDRDRWVDFMMKFELGLEKPNINAARNSAAAIGIAYIVGGIIPLSAYFPAFGLSTKMALFYSSLITAISLFVFGYFKTKIIGQPPIKGALKVLGIGAAAAASAYFIANLIV